jgi:hypothetical protein
MHDTHIEITHPELGSFANGLDVLVTEIGKLDVRRNHVSGAVLLGELVAAVYVVVVDVCLAHVGNGESVFGDERFDPIGVALRIDDEGVDAVVNDVPAIPEPGGVDDDDVRCAACTHEELPLLILAFVIVAFVIVDVGRRCASPVESQRNTPWGIVSSNCPDIFPRVPVL